MPTDVHTVHHSFGNPTGQILPFCTACGNVRNCPSKSIRWNLRGTVWCIFPCTFAVYSLAVDWPSRPNLWPRGKSPSITAPVTVGSLPVDKLPTPFPSYFRASPSLHSLQAVVYLLQIVPRPTENKRLLLIGKFLVQTLCADCDADVLSSDTWRVANGCQTDARRSIPRYKNKLINPYPTNVENRVSS